MTVSSYRLLLAALSDAEVDRLEQESTGCWELVRLRDVDPEEADPGQDCVVAGVPPRWSRGDRRTVEHLQSTGVPLLVVVAGDVDDVGFLGPWDDSGWTVDFVAAPVRRWEVAARLQRLLSASEARGPVQRRGLVIDHRSAEVVLPDATVHLSQRELSVLRCLARHFPHPVSREMLARACASAGFSATGRSVDLIVHRVRRKLGDAGRHVQTVAGVGYRLVESSVTPVPPSS